MIVYCEEINLNMWKQLKNIFSWGAFFNIYICEHESNV